MTTRILTLQHNPKIITEKQLRDQTNKTMQILKDQYNNQHKVVGYYEVQQYNNCIAKIANICIINIKAANTNKKLQVKSEKQMQDFRNRILSKYPSEWFLYQECLYQQIEMDLNRYLKTTSFDDGGFGKDKFNNHQLPKLQLTQDEGLFIKFRDERNDEQNYYGVINDSSQITFNSAPVKRFIVSECGNHCTLFEMKERNNVGDCFLDCVAMNYKMEEIKRKKERQVWKQQLNNVKLIALQFERELVIQAALVKLIDEEIGCQLPISCKIVMKNLEL